MKITKQKLKQIIKEELENVLGEKANIRTVFRQTHIIDHRKRILNALGGLNIPPGREANLDPKNKNGLMEYLKVAVQKKKLRLEQAKSIYNLALDGKDEEAMAMVKKLIPELPKKS